MRNSIKTFEAFFPICDQFTALSELDKPPKKCAVCGTPEILHDSDEARRFSVSEVLDERIALFRRASVTASGYQAMPRPYNDSAC
jgi:hypothetical protein